MQRNLPTLATGSAMRTPLATTGRLSILAALMADRSASTEPSISFTTPDRSRIWPSLSNRPGFSWPLGPKRSSFMFILPWSSERQARKIAPAFSPRMGARKLRLFGREAGRQILGNRVEFGVRSLGAIVGHLVDQGLPARGIQALLGGDFRGMALGADPHHHVAAGAGRQGLEIVLCQGGARRQHQQGKEG